jgi:hypothetical protein
MLLNVTCFTLSLPLAPLYAPAVAENKNKRRIYQRADRCACIWLKRHIIVEYSEYKAVVV